MIFCFSGGGVIFLGSLEAGGLEVGVLFRLSGMNCGGSFKKTDIMITWWNTLPFLFHLFFFLDFSGSSSVENAFGLGSTSACPPPCLASR